jgi:hypothetical protein
VGVAAETVIVLRSLDPFVLATPLLDITVSDVVLKFVMFWLLRDAGVVGCTSEQANLRKPASNTVVANPVFFIGNKSLRG